ncbi:hypothetical protein ACIGXI_19420 [Kitasatospora aureofaciens]|uniref:hypothetical protein n=1 Tax=Kitasatospora aureofaciens TaxID=1894 RepID=UPI0037C8C93C
MTVDEQRGVPAEVLAAERLAARLGFGKSCTREVGRLLALAAAAKPGAPGGLLLMDDFTPSPHWPPRFGGEVDGLRLHYLTHPALEATEVLTAPGGSAVLAVRKA